MGFQLIFKEVLAIGKLAFFEELTLENGVFGIKFSKDVAKLLVKFAENYVEKLFLKPRFEQLKVFRILNVSRIIL